MQTDVPLVAQDAVWFPEGIQASAQDPSQLYLQLMKKCLTNWIYIDDELTSDQQSFWRTTARRVFARLDHMTGAGWHLYRPRNLGEKTRLDGQDWPPTAHTMIGLKRLNNLHVCVEKVLADGVPGDLIETGVWRGGASIFMRAVLKAHGVTDRTVWVADSFEGLPPAKEEYPQDTGSQLHRYSELAISLETVQGNFAKYGLLDNQVRFLKGWFHETLPTAPIGPLSIARLDGDLYESTIVALDALYPKLSVGGFLIVDDYGGLESCRQAVADFRTKHGVTETIHMIDDIGAYWRRER